MKAVVLPAFGDPSQLELRNVSDPSAGPGELKVRMSGASINPVDWKLRSGALQGRMPLELPAILGRDCAGTVLELGKEVSGFKVGDRVMGLVNRGYAELVVAGVDAWAHVPPNLELVDAGALPLVLLTGSQLVEEATKPRAGDALLVTGALGSVGRVAVFAAKALGAKVWAGVRGKQKSEAAKLGADAVVALDDEAEVAALPELDCVADTVGGETIQKLLSKVKRGGTIGSVVGEPPGAKERGLVVHPMLAHPDSKRLAELGRAVAEGRLTLPIAKKLPLAAAAEAHRLAEKGGIGGKIVLVGAS